MRPLLFLRRSAAFICLLLPFQVLAAPEAYVSAWNTLYRLDLATGQATAIGDGLGFNDVEGLAISPQGVLYGVADGTVGSGSQITDLLIHINTSTGIGTLVAPLDGLSGLGPNGQLDYGLAFTCDGKLWASSDTTGELWEVNPATAAVRKVTDTGAPITGLGGRKNTLYGIGVQNGFGNLEHQALYQIDPSSGKTTRIGSLNVNATLSSGGADFDNKGTLWATLDSQPPEINVPTRLAHINLSTGHATITTNISGIRDNVSVRGLAIAPPSCNDAPPVHLGLSVPVPGPSAPLLFALAVMALAAGKRRLPSSIQA